MNRHLIAGIAGLGMVWGSVWAGEMSNDPVLAARRAAAARYAEDKKLCAEETTSHDRLQCLRDAKAEYARAKAAAVASMPPPPPPSMMCAECGKVTDVKVVEKKGDATPLGVIAGGVVGGLLGHQVGGGTGKDVATIAGAAGGAYAGHEIEKNARSTKTWVVTVLFENGDERKFNYDKDPGLLVGTPVRSTSEGLVPR